VALTKIVPRIPEPVLPKPSPAPQLKPRIASVTPVKEETLLSWAKEMITGGIKALPKMTRQLAIQLGIVLAINFIFWPLKTYSLPGPIASIVSLVVFLTATYNNIVPKTIYWVIVFTFGKRLFMKTRREGVLVALQPIRDIVPEFTRSYKALGEKAYSLLLIGGGIGLIVANNFASYSRFSGARNKFDKYFVVIVISFAVSYILGESRQGWLFKFSRLAAGDLSRLLKRHVPYSDDYTFILLTGFVSGLLLDAPLIMLKLMYGGYILGGMCILAAIAMPYVQKARLAK
jgi:hypothetical protein